MLFDIMLVFHLVCKVNIIYVVHLIVLASIFVS
jgi:hypothetical protein